jgi:5,10-methylenetetrahydromethanopterin reductase
MNQLPELGVRAHGDLDPQSCIAVAEAAEAHGFASLWFAENPFQRGLMPAASACAVTTRRMRIGLGIVNPYTRHPSLIAMEFAALDELAAGRARLGIGAGIGGQITRLGFAWQPLAAMRDSIHIVRGLLAGDEVTYRGRVFSVDRAKLRFRPASPQAPIYMAAMGDRSLALCGEIADGLIVSNLCPPGYTERAVGIVERAAAKAGRPSPRVVQYVPCVARPDREEARRAAVLAIGETLAALWPAGSEWPTSRETIVAESGIPRADFVAALDRLRHGDPPQQTLDDRFIDAFAIAGTAEQCLDRAARYRGAGVTELVLTFAGAQATRDIAYLGGAVAELAAAEVR